MPKLKRPYVDIYTFPTTYVPTYLLLLGYNLIPAVGTLLLRGPVRRGQRAILNFTPGELGPQG
jgi:hypothetical protein